MHNVNELLFRFRYVASSDSPSSPGCKTRCETPSHFERTLEPDAASPWRIFKETALKVCVLDVLEDIVYNAWYCGLLERSNIAITDDLSSLCFLYWLPLAFSFWLSNLPCKHKVVSCGHTDCLLRKKDCSWLINFTSTCLQFGKCDFKIHSICANTKADEKS